MTYCKACHYDHKGTEVSGGWRGRERKRKHRNGGGGVGGVGVREMERVRSEGGKGPQATTEKVNSAAGDWESVAGKVTVQQAITISELLLTEVSEQDKWKGIVLTQGRAECWEATCWERLRSHQGILKTLADSWAIDFSHLFILFFWQFDGHVCTVECVGDPCA